MHAWHRPRLSLISTGSGPSGLLPPSVHGTQSDRTPSYQQRSVARLHGFKRNVLYEAANDGARLFLAHIHLFHVQAAHTGACLIVLDSKFVKEILAHSDAVVDASKSFSQLSTARHLSASGCVSICTILPTLISSFATSGPSGSAGAAASPALPALPSCRLSLCRCAAVADNSKRVYRGIQIAKKQSSQGPCGLAPISGAAVARVHSLLLLPQAAPGATGRECCLASAW